MNQRLIYSKKENAALVNPMGNDQQLWEAFRLGNQRALAIMYQHHFFKLYNYGLKITPDAGLVKDCIQDLFIHIWKSRKNLTVATSIKYYLFKALRRKIITELKKNKVLRTDNEFQNFVFELPYEEKLIQSQIAVEQKEKLLECLNKLPKRQKEALFLRYYENMTSEEVSAIMSLSIDSTYVLFSKALHYLRKNTRRITAFGLPILFLFK